MQNGRNILNELNDFNIHHQRTRQSVFITCTRKVRAQLEYGTLQDYTRVKATASWLKRYLRNTIPQSYMEC